MAKKISELPNLTTPTTGDVIPIISPGGSSPTTAGINLFELQNFLQVSPSFSHNFSGNAIISGIMSSWGLYSSGDTILGSGTTNYTQIVGAVNHSGNLTMSGNLRVTGNTTLGSYPNSQVNVSGNLFRVTGRTHLAGNVGISGGLNLSGNLGVSGDSVLGYLTSNLTKVNGDLQVTNGASVVGMFGVNGNSYFTGELTGTKSLMLTQHLRVSGNTVLGNVATNTTSITGGVFISDNTRTNTLSVVGQTLITGILGVSGNVTLGDNSTDTITLLGKTFSNEPIVIYNNFYTSGSGIVSGSFGVSGNLAISGKSYFSGDATFRKNVNISGKVNSRYAKWVKFDAKNFALVDAIKASGGGVSSVTMGAGAPNVGLFTISFDPPFDTTNYICNTVCKADATDTVAIIGYIDATDGSSASSKIVRLVKINAATTPTQNTTEVHFTAFENAAYLPGD